MFYVYTILSIKKDFRYIGFSDNPNKRLEAHNNGYVKSTTCYRPCTMVLLEKKASSKDARKTEKYYKSGFGRKVRDRILSDIDISSRLVEAEIIDIT